MSSEKMNFPELFPPGNGKEQVRKIPQMCYLQKMPLNSKVIRVLYRDSTELNSYTSIIALTMRGNKLFAKYVYLNLSHRGINTFCPSLDPYFGFC